MADGKVVVALAHPARRAALTAIAQRPTSPEEIATATGLRLGTVAYHVRALRNAGLIELDSEERVRGAVKHYYRIATINGLARDVGDLARNLDDLSMALATAGGDR